MGWRRAPTDLSQGHGSLRRTDARPQKYNQIRNFTKRGVEVYVVPWDYDFSKETYDGLFIRSVVRRWFAAGGRRPAGNSRANHKRLASPAPPSRSHVRRSNGPGDPRNCKATIQNIAKALTGDKPIFGYVRISRFFVCGMS